MIVGRWPDGTPLVHNEKQPSGLDPHRGNHFGFAQTIEDVSLIAGHAPSASPISVKGWPADSLGARCPLFAHIRKVNPRDHIADQGPPGKSLAAQMLRRGIPYGPAFVSGVNESQDRGLLFIAYCTSLEEQFRLLNTVWMNNAATPLTNTNGFDLLVGQTKDGVPRTATFTLPSSQCTITTLARFVTATGGAFLFAPSLSTLRAIAQG